MSQDEFKSLLFLGIFFTIAIASASYYAGYMHCYTTKNATSIKVCK